MAVDDGLQLAHLRGKGLELGRLRLAANLRIAAFAHLEELVVPRRVEERQARRAHSLLRSAAVAACRLGVDLLAYGDAGLDVSGVHVIPREVDLQRASSRDPHIVMHDAIEK